MAKSLAVVTAKKENIFSQIQGIYDLTKKLSDKEIQKQFLTRSKSANKLLETFSEVFDQYHELELEADPEYKPNYAALESANELVDYINANLALLENKLQPKAKAEPQVSAQTPQSFVRLPKLELKPFTGDLSEWVSFINLYNSTIHKNASLPDEIKFQYLLSVVTGEPFNLIKALPISTANYAVAYELLNQRYHSPRRLVTLHLNQILDLPSVSHSPSHMRKFINSYSENVQALKGLKIDITVKNPLLSAIILRKMDNQLRTKFEHFNSSNRSDDVEDTSVLPDVTGILKFLNQECSEIEEASLYSTFTPKASSAGRPIYSKPKHVSYGQGNVSLVTTSGENNSKPPQCFLCNKNDHKIYSCAVFKSKDPKSRFKIVKEHKRCISCLGNHNRAECRSKFTCHICHQNHHTMLHFESKSISLPQAPQTVPQYSSQDSTGHQQDSTRPTSDTTLTCQESTNVPHSLTTVLLGTLLVKLTSPNGITHVFRALADSGSQSSFLTERAAQLLCVSRTHTSHQVLGLSQTPTRSKGYTSLSVQTVGGKVISPQQPFLILDKICVDLPRTHLAPEVMDKVRPYLLADPTFHLPGGIDILLGGSLFPLILTQVAHNLGPGLPTMIGMHFGFIVMGDAPCAPHADCNISSHVSTSLLAVTDIDLHSSLQRFWHQEEPPLVSKQSEEDKLCDEHFFSTHSRDSTGRYCVRLPFKSEHPSLGHSRSNAETRLYSLERKFNAQPHFKKMYSDFMSDYLSSGHMELAENIDVTLPHYFLPHHGVLKESSSTTRLRTVFDASAKASNDLSLNHILLTGRKLQTNICDLLLTFRTHNVVFSCDIRQMYRQIMMHPDDQPYQLILWRDTPDKPISTFKLTTVTYGINCSPYLAIRTLNQLAADEGDAYPAAAEILRTQTFVDDIISGADSEEEAIALQKQLISLLDRGGFELRKWTSNSSQLLKDLPDGHLETPVFLQDTLQPHFTILGLHWSPSSDTFTYNLNFPQNCKTKRQILSVIAQIYDPCGFLSPIVMWAKRFMQLMWTKGIDWDQPLPSVLLDMWQDFINTSDKIKDIKIPRALHLSPFCNLELHGFSDGSQNGYAAVVYLRVQLSDKIVVIRQVLAKTRVAPLKQLTVPRLELSAAHLLAQLVAYCLSIFNKKYNFSSITLWCDSTVTLTWLQTPPYRLKTFVANRVAQAQELVPSHCWRHIDSIHNPADCASRGILPSDLPTHELWWYGPPWLQQTSDNWPVSKFTPTELTETGEDKPLLLTTLVASTPQEWNLISKYSNLHKLQRVMAYILRFFHNSLTRLRDPCQPEKRTGPLSSQELTSALLAVYKAVQATAFMEDISSLKKAQPTSPQLQRLSPFLDKKGILRVGGRLNASQLPEALKHQVILPKRHHVVNLLIDSYHTKYLHSGAQLTQSLLAHSVWILSARSVIRSRIYKCVICFRHKPQNKMPLMGDLPSVRVTPSRPFLSSGIDYGGPFMVKVHNLRSIRHVKVYICVFICMVTKAVHLEVVTDLTTEAFLAALTRFVSRRGLCLHIYSDCGTNFIGANNVLQNIVQDNIYSSSSQDKIHTFTAHQGINFHFNPPAAPHQGGLWESAIKSVKHHLRRVIGEHVLTLSEFLTLTTQVEAMLNSRPLTPLTNDPSDLTALTPGHFLVGSPLTAVPEDDLHDIPTNRLKHWQLVQALNQRIWKRWHLEYIYTLQQRGKWNVPAVNLQIGDLVLVHQPTTPLTWPLARIVGVSPGKDGVVRVVHLKTQHGTLTRPAHKVFRLPSSSKGASA